MGLRFRKALSNWAFVSTLLTACAAVILAFQFDATYTVDVGGYYDRVYLRDFHRPEVGQGEDWFRWTEGAGTIRLPGLGARGCWLSLRMQGWRPAEASPARLSLLVNGHLLWRGGVGRDWQEYRFWVAPGLVRGGTLRLTLQSDTFVPVEQGVGGDTRTLGVAVTQVTVGTPRASFALGWPAFDQLGWVLLFAVALYLSLSSLLMSPRWAAIVSALASAGLGWALAARRLWTAIYTPRLAIVTALGLLLLPALRWIFGRVFAWGQVAAEEKDLRLLLAVFLIGFLLKAGGLLYPFSVAIDLKWHLEKAQQVVQGGLADLYRPGALASWITPQGMGSGGESAIPYSPFYHITAAAFFFLPWPPYATANVLSVLLDTTRCFLVYFLTCRLGLGRRTGLLAGLLYAAMPATFLLHSWGNVPTTTGLWWCLAATCYLIGGWERLGKVRTWAGLVFFLLGAMLYYSVTAVLIVVFQGILLLGLWLNGQRLPVRPLRPVLLALVVAVGLAVAIYYGQYIPLLVQAFTRGGGLPPPGEVPLLVRPTPVAAFLSKTLTRLSSLRYGLLWPLLLTVLGLVVGRRHLRRPLLRWTLLAWFATGLLFLAVDYRVNLVDKPLFFVMPPLAIGAAMGLEWLWERRPAGRSLVVLVYLFLAAASLHTWFSRLATVTQDWTHVDPRIVGEAAVHGLSQAVRLCLRG